MKNISEHDYKLFKIIYFILLGLSVVGVGFLMIYMLHPFDISLTNKQCIYYALLHIYCPGCGGTHALSEFLRFHFIRSFLYNPLVVLLAYLIVRYLIEGAITFIIKNDGKMHFVLAFRDFYICLGIYIAFIIGRDILLMSGLYDYGGTLLEYWIK